MVVQVSYKCASVVCKKIYTRTVIVLLFVCFCYVLINLLGFGLFIVLDNPECSASSLDTHIVCLQFYPYVFSEIKRNHITDWNDFILFAMTCYFLLH